jgi:hypothetical protein
MGGCRNARLAIVGCVGRYPGRAIAVIDDNFDAVSHRQRPQNLVISGAKRDRSNPSRASTP